jgi:hypothetical protein
MGNSGVFSCRERHSCILLHEDETEALYIPMSSAGIRVESSTPSAFHSQYVRRVDYDPAKATVHYLELGSRAGISPLAWTMLQNVSTSKPYTGEHQMSNDVKEATAAVNEALGKTAAAPAAKAPAKKAAAKSVAKAAAKPVTKAVAKPEPKARAEWKEKTHKVVGADKVKRGAVKDYVDAALGLKKFTLADMDSWARKQKSFGEDADARSLRAERYFVWCRNNEVFAQS